MAQTLLSLSSVHSDGIRGSLLWPGPTNPDFSLLGESITASIAILAIDLLRFSMSSYTILSS